MAGSFGLIEVSDAEPFVGFLFRRAFGSAPPNYPRHFVCLLNDGEGRIRVAGYVHFSRVESFWLTGGLVVDKSVYAAVSKEELASVGPDGSIGQFTMAEGVRQLGDDCPVFALIGDPRSIEVNLKAGYVQTHIPRLYAFWKKRFGPETERAYCERAHRLAPF